MSCSFNTIATMSIANREAVLFVLAVWKYFGTMNHSPLESADTWPLRGPCSPSREHQ